MRVVVRLSEIRDSYNWDLVPCSNTPVLPKRVIVNRAGWRKWIWISVTYIVTVTSLSVFRRVDGLFYWVCRWVALYLYLPFLSVSYLPGRSGSVWQGLGQARWCWDSWSHVLLRVWYRRRKKPATLTRSPLSRLSETMSANVVRKVSASLVGVFICSAMLRARSALSMFVSAVLFLLGCFGAWESQPSCWSLALIKNSKRVT